MPLSRFAPVAAAAVALGAIVWTASGVFPVWRSLQGWEAYAVAQALASGHGFSFPAEGPWPADPIGAPGTYHPTAWCDPIYTSVLAALIWLFAGYHKLAAAILNLVLLLATFATTYLLLKRVISPLAGVAGIAVLALNPQVLAPAYQLSNTALGALLVTLSALALVRYFDAPSQRRAAAVGFMLGLTMLALPATQFFIPAAAIMCAACGSSERKERFARAAAIVVCAALVVLPWTVRNYVVFEKIVPARTGIGQITFVGVVAAAATVSPELIRSPVKPPWKVDTPRAAIRELLMSEEKLDRLETFQEHYAMEVGGHGYSSLDEARRDAWLLQEMREFLLAHPGISIALALAKIEIFIRTMGWSGTVVFALALLGGWRGVRDPALATLALWAALYVAPFTLIVTYFSRYRAPIEPVLVALALFGVWRLAGSTATRRFRDHPAK